MSDTPNKKKGASKSNPGRAVTPTAGREVTDTPSDNPVAGDAPSGDPTVTALDTCVVSLAACRTSLGSYLTPTSSARRVTRAWRDAVNAMVIMAGVLRTNPSIAPSVDADKLASDAAEVTAGKALEASLSTLLKDVKTATRYPLGSGWKGVLDAYHAASRLTEGNTPLTTTLAPVAALFAQSTRDVSAATKAAAQSLAASKATNRATTASNKAVVTRQRAAALAPTPVTPLEGATTPTPAAPTTPAK